MKFKSVNGPRCYNQNNDDNSTVLEPAELKKLYGTQTIQRNKKKIAGIAFNRTKGVKRN